MTEEELGRMVIRLTGDNTQYKRTLQDTREDTDKSTKFMKECLIGAKESWDKVGGAVGGAAEEVGSFLKQAAATATGIVAANLVMKAFAAGIEGVTNVTKTQIDTIVKVNKAIVDWTAYMVGITEESAKASIITQYLTEDVKGLTNAYQEQINVLGDVAVEQREFKVGLEAGELREELSQLGMMDTYWVRLKDKIRDTSTEYEKWKAGIRSTTEDPNSLEQNLDKVFGGPTFWKELQNQVPFQTGPSDTGAEYAQEQQDKINKELELARAKRENIKLLREEVEEMKRQAVLNLSNTATGDAHVEELLPGALQNRDIRAQQMLQDQMFANAQLGKSEVEVARAVRDRQLAQQGLTKEQREAIITQEELGKNVKEMLEGEAKAAQAANDRQQAVQKVVDALKEQIRVEALFGRDKERQDMGLGNVDEGEKKRIDEQLQLLDKQREAQAQHQKNVQELMAGENAAKDAAAHHHDGIQSLINALKEENATLGMNEDALLRRRAAMMGATDEERKEIEALQKTNKEFAEKEQLTQRAKAVLEQYMTPQEKFLKQMQDLGKLRDVLGKDFQKVYDEAIKQAKDIAREELKLDVTFETHGVQALKAGSAEAIAAIEAYKDRAEENKKLREKQAELEEKAKILANPNPAKVVPWNVNGNPAGEQNMKERIDLFERIAKATERQADKEVVVLEPAEIT